MQKRALEAFRLDPEKWGVNAQVFSGRLRLYFILKFHGIYVIIKAELACPLLLVE